MSRQFEILHRDMVLVSFEYDGENKFCSKIEINDSDLRFTPFWIKKYKQELEQKGKKLADYNFFMYVNAWFRNRICSAERSYGKLIYAYFNVAPNDFERLSDKIYFTGLNDNLWLKNKNDRSTYAQVNPYLNILDENTARLQLFGGVHQDIQDIKRRYTSGGSEHLLVDISVSGGQDKCWINDEGIIKLIKIEDKNRFLTKEELENSPDYKRKGIGTVWYNNQVYGEAFASQLAQHLKLNAVKYDLVKLDYSDSGQKPTIASTCPLLNSYDISLVTFKELLSNSNFDNPDMYLSLEHLRQNNYKNESYHEAVKFFGENSYYDMRMFDALIGNPDRLGDNFGMLRSNITGEYLGMAPLYDHGLSLMSGVDINFTEENFEIWLKGEIEDINKVKIDERILHKDSERQILLLENVKDFTIKNNEKFPYPEDRLNKLNAALQTKAASLTIALKDRLFHNKKQNTQYVAENIAK